MGDEQELEDDSTSESDAQTPSAGGARVPVSRSCPSLITHYPSRPTGYTLVELVAVIVIAGVLLASFAPRMPSKVSLTLSARAAQLASDVRYVQALSMTNGQRYCLTLTPSSPYSGYSMTTAASGCVTTIAHPGIFSQPIPICNGTTCMTAPTLTNGYLQFDALGQPYTAAATALASNAVITLTDNGLTQTVTVVPVTGRVTVP